MEREVKILGIDSDALQRLLREKGAQEIFSGRLTDRQFDFPDRRLQEEQKLLRVRSVKAGGVEVVFKGPRAQGMRVKQREERSVVFSAQTSADDVIALLTGIGLTQTGIQEKDRSSFMFNDVRVDIDHYPLMAAYLEIEGPDEGAIDRAIRELGLTNNERVTLSSDELFKRLNPDGDFSHLLFS